MQIPTNNADVPSKFFEDNRKRLKKLLGGSTPIVLTANGLMQRSTDSPYDFIQDGNFWYLTGINVPNVFLVIDKSGEYLVIPELSEAREAFDGAIDSDELSRISGISEVLLEKDGLMRLKLSLKLQKNVAILVPPAAYVESLGMYTNPARRRIAKLIKNINPAIAFLDIRQQIARMRMVKQPIEIKAISRAVDITVESLAAIKTKFINDSYDNERDIEHELSSRFLERGADGHSFLPIVAAGAKAATIHPSNNNLPIKTNDPLLMDVGAKYGQYAGDITRTWAKKPSQRFLSVHASVLAVADFALGLLKPGVNLRDYENKIEKFMGEQLLGLGLINNIEHKAVRKYYPHTTSHFLGIDVHDVGDYEQPLTENVALTVEPGIYIPEEGIGIRIEDDVVITAEGIKILSAGLSRTLN